jgi:hypothetical protein
VSEQNFQLQRFYFGVMVKGGQPQGAPTVLSCTPAVSKDQIDECLRICRLEPPLPAQVSDDMSAAIGLYRGDTIDYVLAISRVTSAGLPQLLFLLLESGLVRQLGGNLNPFIGLAHAEMPLFDSQRPLKALNLDNPKTLDKTDQTEAMQELLVYCQDNMKAVEGLLTALIQAQNVAVLNAPASIEKRLTFLKGLLSMLPLPARVILTFATNVVKPEHSAAQVKFMASDEAPPEHIIFNWENGTLFPAAHENHDYARFIVSQLRLDPSKVIEQTELLSRTAVWRAIRKENLSKALHWVSRRAKVDSAVKAGQPADRETVAGILREDPTLSDDLRVEYSQHLLKFTLALREWETADQIPAIAAGHRDVADAVFNQLRNTATREHPLETYDLVEHWLTEIPEARALPWQQALYGSATVHIEALVEAKDIPTLTAFVYRLSNTEPILKLDQVAAKTILLIRNLAHQSDELAQATLILAASHLPAGDFQKLLGDVELVKRLSTAQKRAIALLQPGLDPSIAIPKNALAEAATSVPTDYRTVILMRFIEAAFHLRRPNLLGQQELNGLVLLAESDQVDRYKTIVKYVVEEFSKPDNVKPLSPTEWVLLPRLYFMVGAIDQGMKLLEYYQNDLFTPERLKDFVNLVGEIFLRTNLSLEQITKILNAFEGRKIRPEPRLRALTASLINHQWDAKMQGIAKYVTAMIDADNELLPILGVNNALRLLQFHTEHQDKVDAVRVATCIANNALLMQDQGPPTLVKAYQHIDANPDMRNVGVDLLRLYIRKLPHTQTAQLPAFFGEKLQSEVGEALRATRMMRIITGGDDFVKLAEMIEMTTHLLTDVAVTYHESKEHPPEHRLRRDIDSMAGNLTDQERQQVADNLLGIAELVYELGSQRTQVKKSKRMGQSTRGVVDEIKHTTPPNAPEFMQWLGLNFTKNIEMELDLTRDSHTHIFGERSAAMLYRESTLIREFLSRLSTAFPQGTPPTFNADALIAEVASLWADISLFNQRQIEETITQQSQLVGLLLRHIADRTNRKVFTDSSHGNKLEEGKLQPVSELEALRWLSGYFGRKHNQR